ncbi:hypothetical protein CEXT_130241 [Caerostris extrusa]|uniref:Uncharacterized protein n=1 Tax=Caerostris extrusa TaxID=172846 RepID=A0AAV4VEY4_CAEEX|nr:hypothetical protein CEXT_130241 [Caerostris extrusa]
MIGPLTCRHKRACHYLRVDILEIQFSTPLKCFCAFQIFFGSIILLICILSLIDVTRAEETNESDESNETKKKPSNENIPEEEKGPAKEEDTTETIQESLEKMEEEAISEIVPVIVKNEEKELEEEEKTRKGRGGK